MNANRDKNILSHIVKYCEQIEEENNMNGKLCLNKIVAPQPGRPSRSDFIQSGLIRGDCNEQRMG